MIQKKKDFKFWLGLIIALLTALSAYLYSSCTTTHSFSLNADSMENPSLIYSDSTGIKNFLNK